MTPTQETATGNTWVVGAVTRQPGGDGTATGSTGVASALSSEGQPGEGETGPDCGIIGGGATVTRRKGGVGKRGANGASNDRLPPLGAGGWGEARKGLPRDRRMTASKGNRRGDGRAGWDVHTLLQSYYYINTTTTATTTTTTIFLVLTLWRARTTN